VSSVEAFFMDYTAAEINEPVIALFSLPAGDWFST
jgi:hypothetical protein